VQFWNLFATGSMLNAPFGVRDAKTNRATKIIEPLRVICHSPLATIGNTITCKGFSQHFSITQMSALDEIIWNARNRLSDISP
jgi:hypothetical protein